MSQGLRSSTTGEKAFSLGGRVSRESFVGTPPHHQKKNQQSHAPGLEIHSEGEALARPPGFQQASEIGEGKARNEPAVCRGECQRLASEF